MCKSRPFSQPLGRAVLFLYTFSVYIGCMEQVTFNIDPYIGAGPIKFGMTKAQVAKILGKPEHSGKTYTGRTDERRGPIAIRYNKKGKVDEISFLDTVSVTFDGQDLFNSPKGLKFLETKEKPVSSYGFKIFFSLGIAVTGISKKKEEKTVSVFAKELESLWKI